MIYLVVGKPGSDKTYIMSKMIRDWIVFDKKIILTNIIVYPLTIRLFGRVLYSDYEKFKNNYFYFSDDIMIEEFWKFSYKIQGKKIQEGKIKLVIDEGLSFINKKYNENKKEFVKFLTQHRKLGYDVYILAQSKMEIDSTIRSLVDRLMYIRYFREVFLVDIPFLRIIYDRNVYDNSLFLVKPYIILPYFFKLYESYKIHLKIGENQKIFRDLDVSNIFDLEAVLKTASNAATKA